MLQLQQLPTRTFHPWCLVEYAKTYSKCVLPLSQFALGLLPTDKLFSKFSQGKIGINTFCISKGGHNRLFNIRYGFQTRILHFISFHENSGTELNHMNCIEPHAKLYHMNKLLSPCCLSWYSTNLIGYGKGNPNPIEWKTNIWELLVLEHKEFLMKTLDSWFICFVDIFF